MLDEQPVETTLYSLTDLPPPPTERRDGERYMSLLRVGSLMIGDKRELCLIRNISAGGMMIRAYCPIPVGTRLSIELKQGEPVAGSALWCRDDCVGVEFDGPIDVIALLSASSDGPRPRMPRIEVRCLASVRQDATVHRTTAVNISQGGIRVETSAEIPVAAEVIVSLANLPPTAAVVRWKDDGAYGLTFNRVLPLPVLVSWLQQQREKMRAAG